MRGASASVAMTARSRRLCRWASVSGSRLGSGSNTLREPNSLEHLQDIERCNLTQGNVPQGGSQVFQNSPVLFNGRLCARLCLLAHKPFVGEGSEGIICLHLARTFSSRRAAIGSMS